MARFFERKISCDKLKQIMLADGQVIAGGARSRLIVTVNEMLEGVNQQGQPNGQFVEYKAKWKIDKNKIYAVRDLTFKNPANTGEVDTEEYQHGDNHTGTVTGKFDSAKYVLNVILSF